ncbi:MAG: acyl carrier protein [Ruminococcus sp.]|nr:acyl carrier protein [Ruminococcus sp.]
MFEDVKKILVEQLHCDASVVTPDASIKEDLGADSLDILQLLMTIEEEHGIVIPDEELAQFEKVQDIVDFLEKQK